jgi:adenine-specific DNA-methyltransferase
MVRCDDEPATSRSMSVGSPETRARTPQENAIAGLIERVRAEASGPDPQKRRAALSSILENLDVPPAELGIWSNGIDVLGSAYEQLLTGAERRNAGQFQTPFFAADLMAAWLLREPTRLLLDPGVGTGRLLFRSGIRADAPERMLGLDIDPIACSMASINLSFRGLAECSQVRRADFLLDELVERPDALICNPPYSRHHSIPAAAKLAIHSGLERRSGVRLSRLTALHALFLVRALEIVAPGGRIAFITPATWLDVGYGFDIKRHLLTHADVEGIVYFHGDCLPFGSDVMSSAAITFLRTHPVSAGASRTASSSAQKPTRVVQLPEHPASVDDVLSALNRMTPKNGLRVAEVLLAADRKWGPGIPRGRARAMQKGQPLGELARIRRGVATGANSFFVLSQQARQELGLSRRDLQACITTPRLINGLELTAGGLAELPDRTPRWALDCRRPNAEAEDTPLGRYLRQGRELGVVKGYLVSRRKPWYALEQRGDCPILFTYFNRSAPRFIRNRARALPLNTFLIVEPNEDVDADRLWVALSSDAITAQLQAAGRSYAGMWKLEPSELSLITVTL